MEQPQQQDEQQQQQQKNLNTKYQKLAAEYAKVRSQLQVLKKAVVEEQSQSSGLRETLASQDQCVRKLEQELDSVKFRNRQLEKRIEVLQQHNAASSSSVSSPPHHHHHNQHHQQSTTTFDSNLLLHVEQNKQLQESLALLSEKYTSETTRLKRMIDNDMVHRDLLDSMKHEHAMALSLVNKKFREMSGQYNELLDKYTRLEFEKSSSSGGHGDQKDLDSSSASNMELVNKLSNSEVERERLHAELQIVNLKLKRLSSVEEQRDNTVTSPVVETNMIGRCVTSGELDNELVNNVLRERNNQLVKLLQLSDSKAVYYYHEAHSLCRLVRNGQFNYKRLDAEFAKLKLKYRGVQDELEDIKRGYEEQVNSLTEHVAILNEKLAGMVDEMSTMRR